MGVSLGNYTYQLASNCCTECYREPMYSRSGMPRIIVGNAGRYLWGIILQNVNNHWQLTSTNCYNKLLQSAISITYTVRAECKEALQVMLRHIIGEKIFKLEKTWVIDPLLIVASNLH